MIGKASTTPDSCGRAVVVSRELRPSSRLGNMYVSLDVDTELIDTLLFVMFLSYAILVLPWKLSML